MLPPSTTTVTRLTASTRRVSENFPNGERRQNRANQPRCAGARSRSAFLVTITDTVQRLDMGEIVVDDLELLAQPLDVAVDRAVVDIDVLAIGGIHQLVPVLDMAGPGRERLQDQEFGDGQLDMAAAPGAEMARTVEHQVAALHHRIAVGRALLLGQLDSPQQRPDPLDQEPLGKGLGDVVVGPHPQAQRLVDLVILGCEENDRQIALAAQMAEQFPAVHPWHLDIENGDIDRLGLDAAQRLGAVIVAMDDEPFGLERDRDGSQDVPVVVDERNRVGHLGPLRGWLHRYRARREVPPWPPARPGDLYWGP